MFTGIKQKFKQRDLSIAKFVQKVQIGMVNSVDPDQTAPLGAVTV